MAADPRITISSMKVKKCTYCRKSAADGALFGVLAATQMPDTLCVKCRFDSIDAYHSDTRGIRSDMAEYGVPFGGPEPDVDG